MYIANAWLWVSGTEDFIPRALDNKSSNVSSPIHHLLTDYSSLSLSLSVLKMTQAEALASDTSSSPPLDPMSLDPATALPVVPPDQVKLPIPPPEVTAADEGHSEISTLWLQSRLISLPSETPKYRREAEDRPLTIETICIAARLLRLCAGRFVGIFTAGKEKRIIAWVGGKVIRGLLPTAKYVLWFDQYAR